MTLDWTSMVVALVALIGTLYTARQTRAKSKKSTIIDQAGQVATIATDQLLSVVEELKAVKEEIRHLDDEAGSLRDEMAEAKREARALRAENQSLRVRVVALEQEVIRLGGDPALVLVKP